MLEVIFDTYADGNPYRRDQIIVNDRKEIGGIENFDGFSGTLVVDVCEMVRCTYCGQLERKEVDRCGCCGQHM